MICQGVQVFYIKVCCNGQYRYLVLTGHFIDILVKFIAIFGILFPSSRDMCFILYFFVGFFTTTTEAAEFQGDCFK